jgi:hypothetical protein
MVLISRSVYFSGNQSIARPLRSNALAENPLFNNSNAHVLAALTMLGTFRLIADNPLPTVLLPAVRFGSAVVNNKVLKVRGSFHDKRKILLCGSINRI